MRERRYRRTLAVALLASVLIHALFLWTSSELRVRPTPYALPAVETVPAPEGLVVVEVAPSELEAQPEEPRPEPSSPEATPPPEPEPERVEVPETDVTGAPGVAAADEPGAPPTAGEGEEEELTNAERLTIRFSDARLWFDPRDPFLYGERLERFARADSAVRAILREWLDSLALSDEQRRRAMDWTIEKDGERWGISPEGLHLGNITIPIPFGFAPTGPKRREFEQAIRDLREIELQNLRLELEAIADERREEMRKRSEEEVRRRAGDTLMVRAPPIRDPPRR